MRYRKVQELSDRELRVYRRRLQNRILFRRRAVALLSAICLAVVLTVSFHSMSALAGQTPAPEQYKYYKRVEIQKGDSVWAYAREYMDREHYPNMAAYIAEVERINHLNGLHEIVAGNSLVLPYYSTEYK